MSGVPRTSEIAQTISENIQNVPDRVPIISVKVQKISEDIPNVSDI